MQPQANIPLSTGPGGDSLKRLISEIEHEVNMSKSHILTLVLLILAAVAWALPQGTFFWDFESPGPNNNYWPSGWTYSPTGLTIGQYGAGLYHSETRSLEFRGQNGQFYIISQPLYFVAGEALTFSCWVKNAGNGTVDTRLEWATSTSGP